MSEYAKCECCDNTGRRRRYRYAPEGWLFMEAKDDENPEATIVVSVCSEACALQLWHRQGVAGPRLDEPLPAPKPPIRPIEKPPTEKPEQEKSRLWEIESHISIGNRFGAYLRLLQNLATEVERLMPVFEEIVAESVAEGAKRADPDGKLLRRQYVVDELRKHLNRIEAAAELDGPKEKKS